MGVSGLESRREGWNISSPLHNKLAPEDRSIHAWYRFVLSYPPHLVRDYLREFELGIDDVVLDPFCGTGTTLVECKKQGIGSVGLEANRFAAFASGVKIRWDVRSAELVAEASRIAGIALAKWSADGISPIRFQKGVVAEHRSLFGLMGLTQVEKDLILKDSISPLPLHRCLTLKELIAGSPAHLQDHLTLALAWVIVNVAGNIRFGPEIGITSPKLDAEVVESWLAQVLRMAGDLESESSQSGVKSLVIPGDARRMATSIAQQSISAVITSPPYPNEKDYTRTTRLESVLLGFIRSKQDLRDLKTHLLRSNTRNVYVNDDDDKYVSEFEEIQRIARQIEDRRLEMGKTSGFERLYHRVARLYFGGMAKHFEELKPYLKPGAKLAYVVGDQASYLQVMIRTSELLKEIAVHLGYEYIESRVFRTRLATSTRQQLVEDVLILRWPG